MDYKELGLKSGIEIHQQLDTCKLFCNCPSKIRDDTPDFTVKRRLRAVVGETGEVDKAAVQEMQKEKYYIYEGYHDSTCLIEIDEEPPRPLNKEALSIVLQMAKMLKTRVVDQIQVMRKTVVDGSNVSGFQRTALVGVDGKLATKEGSVTIPTVCLEEDAAKIIKQTPDYSQYNLSKLGIPLIEISTGPDMRTPEQVKEVSAKIGMMLRSTGKVKRGIGTIRQDVNVSIAGGNRVEIKGAQDLKMIPDWVKNEAVRQKTLLDLKNELPKLEIEKILVDLTHIFSKSESKVIKGALEKGGIVLGARMDNLAGKLGIETQPNRRVGSELSDYGKVKGGVGGLFHSDELPRYGITEDDVAKVREMLHCKDEDAFVLIADDAVKTEKAMDAVIDRANQLSVSVPKEVRKPNADGTTSYMRPMPGADRMYPETDVRPTTVTQEELDKIELPELLEDLSKRLAQHFKISVDLANSLTRAQKAQLFEQLCGKLKGLKPAFIAETLIGVPLELSRKYKVQVSDEILVKVLEKIESGKVAKDSLMEILIDYSKTKQLNFAKFALMDEAQVREEIETIVAENKNAPYNALMGKVMGKLRGKASGRLIAQILGKLVKR